MANRDTFSKKKADAILEAMRKGASMNVASGYVGVPHNTVSRWIKRAAKPKASKDLKTFAKSVEKLRASNRMKMAETLQLGDNIAHTRLTQMHEEVQAGAEVSEREYKALFNQLQWRAERMSPNEYGKVEVVRLVNAKADERVEKLFGKLEELMRSEEADAVAYDRVFEFLPRAIELVIAEEESA